MKILRDFLAITTLVVATACLAGAQTMAEYTYEPQAMAQGVKPNALVLLSNDHTGFYKGYTDTYNHNRIYNGYFDPNKDYTYVNNQGFEPHALVTDRYASSNSYWSGNFLNWLTMSHADFMRKVLTGGTRGADSDTETRLARADIPNDGHKWTKTYDGSDLNQLVPSAYAAAGTQFYNVGTDMVVQDSGGSALATLTVEVTVCDSNVGVEGNCKSYGNNHKPQGIIQRYGDKINFGLMTYSHAKAEQGGVLRRPIGSVQNEFGANNGQEVQAISGMIRYINSYTQKSWDPLGEMYFDALRYLTWKGDMATPAYCSSNLQSDDSYPVFGCKNNVPWPEDPVTVGCQNNSIIILNDEYPSREHDSLPGSYFNAGFTSADLPLDVSTLTDEVADQEGITGNNFNVSDGTAGGCADNPVNALSQVSGICPSEPQYSGTFYLAGMANWAFTNDLRTGTGWENKQNIRTYAIAYRAASGSYAIPQPPLNQMWLAAKYGNFDDKNSSATPDQPSEWMVDPAACTAAGGDPYNLTIDTPEACLPQGYRYADDPGKLEAALLNVFDDVLKRSASGTSVSVLSTSGEGEGNLVQAYYRPLRTENGIDIAWTGYLQSLWVDKLGLIREDTNHNLALDESADNIIKYFTDDDGITRVKRYTVSAGTPYPDLTTATATTAELDDIEAVWSGGKTLQSRSASSRVIKTYLDMNQNQSVDTGEELSFDQTNFAAIQPYLGVADPTATGLFDYLGSSEVNRAKNLIEWIRGNDPSLNSGSFQDGTTIKLRTRNMNGQAWKLGDIINSTPVAVSRPPDNYHIIYSDSSYQTFFNQYKNRETVVYVGGNDGMLHAFTSWRYDETTQTYIQPQDSSGTNLDGAIGSELWAYIPQALLPHLKWLPREDYSHVYYVDQQPRIFDARVFPVDATHPGGWGTVLVVGFNMGGGEIFVNNTFDDGTGTSTAQTRNFYPGYVALDITDPRNPQLMWERSYEELNFSTSFPTVLRIGQNLTNGSGWDANNSKGSWFLTFGSGPDSYSGESLNNGHIYVVDLATGAPYKNGANNDYLFTSSEPRSFMASPVSFDKELNFNTDAFYIGETFDTTPTATSVAWQGTLYKVRIPWTASAAGADYGSTTEGSYSATPSEWSLVALADSPRPITAAAAISIDKFDNTWIYVGTGRYFSRGLDSDQTSIDQEYLFGVKDPFFNQQLYSAAGSYYLNTSTSKTLGFSDLLNADPYFVATDGTILNASGGSFSVASDYPTFNMLLNGNPDQSEPGVRGLDGWYRSLIISGTAERSLNKPIVMGGLSLFSVFTPISDVCSFGGSSRFYAPYFETGTAFPGAIFEPGTTTVTDNSGTERDVVTDNISLGDGTTSSPGVHVGQQEDGKATAYVQQGTGAVVDFEIDPALKIRSGIRSWIER